MKNINEIHLEDIIDSLRTAHVKLDLEFLKKLLKNASGSDKSWRNVEFGKKIGCTINTEIHIVNGINGWINGHTTVPVPKLIKIVELSDYNWIDIENNLSSIKAGRKKGEIRPRFPMKIGHKIGLIVGHILGDGAINKRGESIFFCNSNPELLNEFIECMKDFFGLEPRIWVQKPKKFEEKTQWLKRVTKIEDAPQNHVVGLFYPKICVQIIKSIFGNFADGKEKRITQEIKESDSEFKRGLIRAFFDDEGTVYKDRCMMRLFQDRKDILEEIKSMLEEFNISSSRIRSCIKRDKERHYFDITNYFDFLSFYKRIGCTSTYKKISFESSIALLRKGRKSKYILSLETTL